MCVRLPEYLCVCASDHPALERTPVGGVGIRRQGRWTLLLTRTCFFGRHAPCVMRLYCGIVAAQTLRLWDARTGKCVRVLKVQTDIIG